MELQSGSLGPDHLASAQHSVISYHQRLGRRQREGGRGSRPPLQDVAADDVGQGGRDHGRDHASAATMQAPQVQGPYDLEL